MDGICFVLLVPVFFTTFFRCRGMTKSCIAQSYLHVLLFLPYDLNCGLMVHCWKTINLKFVNTLLTQAVMPRWVKSRDYVT